MMTITDPRASIHEAQRAWAASRGIEIDAQGYTLGLDDNLFQPLNEATLAELAGGAGEELGADGKRGKAQALHSSSALAINVFDYWRDRPAEPLRRALDLDQPIREIRFEQTFSMGMQGTKPHLDTTLTLEGGHLIAIESKFCEPYPYHRFSPFADSYLRPAEGRWTRVGLPRCQALVEALQSGERRFSYLNAEQLLKHALGLGHTVGTDYSLWYLWYDLGGEAGTAHRRETEEFAARVDPSLGFRAMSYQELIPRLEEACGAEHAEYAEYLRTRYRQHRASADEPTDAQPDPVRERIEELRRLYPDADHHIVHDATEADSEWLRRGRDGRRNGEEGG